MFSRIVPIVFAVSCIFVVNGSVIKPARRWFLEPVLACTQTANSAAMAYDKAMEGRRDTDADDIKLSCLSTEVYDACLAAIIKATPSPAPRVWHIFATVAYQTSVLLKRANLCPEITIDKLKKITEESGIIKEEGLSNIENDPYVNCAGDALKKCLVGDVALSERHEDTETEDHGYVQCMKRQAETCTADIMRHFVEQLVRFEGLGE